MKTKLCDDCRGRGLLRMNGADDKPLRCDHPRGKEDCPKCIKRVPKCATCGGFGVLLAEGGWLPRVREQGERDGWRPLPDSAYGPGLFAPEPAAPDQVEPRTSSPDALTLEPQPEVFPDKAKCVCGHPFADHRPACVEIDCLCYGFRPAPKRTRRGPSTSTPEAPPASCTACAEPTTYAVAACTSAGAKCSHGGGHA